MGCLRMNRLFRSLANHDFEQYKYKYGGGGKAGVLVFSGFISLYIFDHGSKIPILLLF